MNICSALLDLLHADRRTNRQTKDNESDKHILCNVTLIGKPPNVLVKLYLCLIKHYVM
jgi:hypothetical protein